MRDRDVVLVLGIPRTGSSAITRVLSLCGCALPSAVFGADVGNSKGFWEPAEAANLNLEFLMRHRTADDLSKSLAESCDKSEAEEFVEQLCTFLRKCPGESPLVIKDPLINDLLEFWLDAVRREGLSTKIVICVRDPYGTLASLGARDPKSVRASIGRWLKINLEAERYSRDLPRVFVKYSNLMKDWRAEVSRISRALCIRLKPLDRAIDEFLTPELYHHRDLAPIGKTLDDRWLSRVYEILSATAQDEPIDHSALNEVYVAFRPNAPRLAVVSEESIDSLYSYFKRRPIWKSGRDY